MILKGKYGVLVLALVAVVALAASACGSSEEAAAPSAPAAAAAAAPAAAGGGSAAAPSAPSAPSAPAAAAPALAAVQGSSAAAASGGSGSAASSGSITVEPVEQVSATVTVVLDNVGSPQFLNGKGTWPDVMFHGFFGFQEPALGWEPTFDDQGNAIVNTDRACHAGYVATGWEMIVPKKGGGELTMEGKTLAELDQADLTDPDEQGTIRVHIREGIDFYRIVDGDMVNVGELTGEDFAWSFNDAGADNIESAHSNSSQAYEYYKKWTSPSRYIAEAPNRAFIGDGLQDASSICQDAVWMQSKTLYDELGTTFGVPHGSGPFVVEEWMAAERIVAQSRVDHWKQSPAFDKIIFLQANEAQQRSAMLQTGAADIAAASIQDVGRLDKAGFSFHEGLDTINGNFMYFAGNNWSFAYPPGSKLPDKDLSGTPMIRPGFIPTDKYPWIGDPRLECVGIDRAASGIQDEPGAGCAVANFDFTFDGFDAQFTDDSVGFDFRDTDRFSYDTPRMNSAKAFRKALAYSIERDLIASSVTGGYGGAVYGGAQPGMSLHQLHPEYQERWSYAFDPDAARAHLAESGVEPGFEFEFFCSQGNGTSLEVCEAVVGQWKEHLGLEPWIDSTQYSSRRPTMLGRELHVPWMTRWGPTSKQGRLGDGGGTAGGGLWPLPAGGWNPSLEDNLYWSNREDTRVQAKGSAENLATREAMWDDYFDKTLTIGTVEVPVLIGFNPDTIRGWDLRPYDLPNSFETIVPGK